MPRNVRTARGEVVDFDMLIIKQQLSNAPMTSLDVARRKKFIDSKEGRGGRNIKPIEDAVAEIVPTGQQASTIVSKEAPKEVSSLNDFEPSDTIQTKSAPAEAVPIVPDRKK